MRGFGKDIIFAEIGLIAAVLCGCLYMLAADAPAHYPLVNGAALVVALLLARFCPAPKREPVIIGLLLAILLLLFAPIILGPDLGGVSRWINLGPLSLHAGMLALPAFAVLLSHVQAGMRFVYFAAACLLVALQPDRGSAIALLGCAGIFAVLARGVTSIAMLLGAAACLVATIWLPDPLSGVPFVENIFGDSFHFHPAMGLLLLSGLAAALLLPLASASHSLPRIAMLGVMAGYAFAAMIGHYPYPLIGYGASPIIGFGLALAFLPKN